MGEYDEAFLLRSFAEALNSAKNADQVDEAFGMLDSLDPATRRETVIELEKAYIPKILQDIEKDPMGKWLDTPSFAAFEKSLKGREGLEAAQASAQVVFHISQRLGEDVQPFVKNFAEELSKLSLPEYNSLRSHILAAGKAYRQIHEEVFQQKLSKLRAIAPRKNVIDLKQGK